MKYTTAGEAEIRRILKEFKVLTKEQLIIYLRKILPYTTDASPEHIIDSLNATGKIYALDNECYSLEENIMYGYFSVISFWVFLKIIGDDIPIIDTARYPNDYIFISNGRIYEMIVYDTNGNMKLNYYNHKYKGDETVTPVIVFINRSIKDVDSTCIPQFSYLRATVTAENNSRPKIELEEVSHEVEIK